MTGRKSIAWKGKPVGYMVDARDDFPHCYGVWMPSKSDDTDEFHRELKRNGEDGVEVELDGLAGCAVLDFVQPTASVMNVRLR